MLSKQISLGHAIIEGRFKSYVLCFLPMEGSHNGGKLLECYESIIQEFSIQDKLSRIVTDNASNNIKAFGDLIIPGFEQYFADGSDDITNHDSPSDDDGTYDEVDDTSDMSKSISIDTPMETIINTLKDSFDNIVTRSGLRLPCFAHTLQLVVRDGLQETTCVKNAVLKVSKIARFAHSSVSFAEKLEVIGKTIPTANKTRWNSQLHTVQKILDIPAVQLNTILTDLNRKELSLSARDLAILNEFVSLLFLFSEATTITQAQDSPSISLVAPSILSIYSDLLLEQNNLIYATPLCKALLSSLIGRFGGLLEELEIDVQSSIPVKKRGTYDLYRDPIFLVSSFLDGKFTLKWISESSFTKEKKQIISNKIQNLVVDYCIILQKIVPDSNPNVDEIPEVIVQTTASPGQKRKGLFAYIENNRTKRKIADPFQYIRDEISLFINDDDLDSMLVFQKSSLYKTLCKLASKVLCVPATSAPVERVFSQSGFLFRQHRSSMSKKMLRMLTMLKCNKNLL